MQEVIIASVLGPPRYIRRTYDVLNFSTWSNQVSPSEYVSYQCYRIKHITGDTYVAINVGGGGPDAVSTSNTFIISRNAGRDWSVTKVFYSSMVSCLEVGGGYAFVGTGVGIYRTNDGVDWTLLSGSPIAVKNIIAFPDGKVIATTGIQLFSSLNSGRDWEEIHSPSRGAPYSWFDNTQIPGKPSRAVAGKSSSYVIASMASSLWLTEDFGNSWIKIMEWDSRSTPEQLMFTRDSTFIINLRKLEPGTEEYIQVAISSNNCHSFTSIFNQEAEYLHQMDYIKGGDLILLAHVQPLGSHYYTPLIMYSRNNGVTFNKIEIYPGLYQSCSNWGVCAVTGYIHPSYIGIYYMDILLRKKAAKVYQMGIKLKVVHNRSYNMNLRLRGLQQKSYSMDVVLQKLNIRKNYRTSIRIKKNIGKTYNMDIYISRKIGLNYSMGTRITKRGYKGYSMGCLNKKTVGTTYGMGICLVGDYRGPIKRDVMLAFPQPFALEIQNVNYVLNQDITVQRTDEHGY